MKGQVKGCTSWARRSGCSKQSPAVIDVHLSSPTGPDRRLKLCISAIPCQMSTSRRKQSRTDSTDATRLLCSPYVLRSPSIRSAIYR